MGGWYATVLFWRPQVALLVNETTLLPVLMPFAPATTMLGRFPATLARTLDAHGVPPWFAALEVERSSNIALAPTDSRSVLGVMNEFARLADWRRRDRDDLLALSVELARTPCGPLHSRHVSPDRELAALIAATPRS